MKRLLLSFMLTACLFAQATQGNITRTVTGDATHTVVTISSVTQGDLVFQVTLLLPGGTLATNPVQLVYRPDKGPPGTAQSVMAIFNTPKAAKVSVREFPAGESQLFEAQ